MTSLQEPTRPRRSLLFVPGLRPDMFAKALAAGADMVCVDVEDAVVHSRKDEARGIALSLFGNAAPGHIEQVLRINSVATLDGLKDLQAILQAETPPPALMLPKVKSAEEIHLLAELLRGRCGHIRFHVIIETNQGLERVYEIAHASQRIDSLLFGAVDLSADLRCAKSWDNLLYARSRLAHAAAAAGVDLLDVPYLQIDDLEGLRAEALRSASLGFTGKAAIHPKHLEIIHEAFSPDPATVARARKVIAAFAQDPTGLVVIDGELIELPVVRSLRRALAIAERIEATKT